MSGDKDYQTQLAQEVIEVENGHHLVIDPNASYLKLFKGADGLSAMTFSITNKDSDVEQIKLMLSFIRGLCFILQENPKMVLDAYEMSLELDEKKNFKEKRKTDLRYMEVKGSC